MTLLLLGLAAHAKPFDAEAYGKNCGKNEFMDAKGSRGLADLVELLSSDPVPTTSEKHTNRLKQAREPLRHKVICSPESFRDAALALLPSTKKKDLKLSMELARHAADLQVPNADFAFTNAFDRFLVAQGRPQQYGTQYGQVGGLLCIYPIDPTFTDDKRAEWHVAPLQQTYASFLERMGHKGKKPDEVTLRRLNLMCISEKW